MIVERIVVCLIALLASISTALGQNSNVEVPAGYWVASCQSPKLKIDEGYEVCLINIDTGAYDPGYFSAEFYFAIDYLKNGQNHQLKCAEETQTWEDWGVYLYFSFSYSGSYSQNKMLFDAGDGYSAQNSYQLKPEFIKMNATYECIDSDQLKIVIDGSEYMYYRMTRKE